MPVDLTELQSLTLDALEIKARMHPEWFADVSGEFIAQTQEDRRRCQLAYYEVANPEAVKIHTTMAREVAVVGGNRSSKTDTALAELAIRMTGHIPMSLHGIYPREKLQALPIRARVMCNSLTDTLEPVIKPKLRWDQWNGIGEPGDPTGGHWGWIPQHCLAGGSWEKAYSEKYRTLHVAVDNQWRSPSGQSISVRGISTCQFLSYDQDLTALAGASLHLIINDELSPSDHYRENRMRTLDVRGQIITSFTPPDEIGVGHADVAWFYDEIYERGLPGPGQHAEMATFILWTEQNRILRPADIATLASRMTEEQRDVRLHGKFLHLMGVIYPLFTAQESWWCFRCQKRIWPANRACATCLGTDIDPFTHVITPMDVPKNWPIVFVLDPHPRKKDAMGWFAVTPQDDLIMIAEAEQDGTAEEIKRAVDQVEERLGIRPAMRLMDPNIATESNDKLRRGWTLQRAYDEVGLRCDLAIDELGPGIQRVQHLLIPDPVTRRPRLQIFSTCQKFIYGMTHWSWDEWTRQRDRDPKEQPRDRYKDFPDLIRYLANAQPTFNGLRHGALPLHYGARRNP